MTRSKYVRVEASVILRYTEEQTSLPPSLPDVTDIERAIANVCLKAWRKGGKKKPPLDAITGGRFLLTLCKPPARRRENQAKPRPDKEPKP